MKKLQYGIVFCIRELMKGYVNPGLFRTLILNRQCIKHDSYAE